MSTKIKNYCYSEKCGPVKLTGFNIEQYWVCIGCREEITERLKNQIEEQIKPDDRNKNEDDEGFGGYPW